MAYALGPVKSHVKDAANHFGPKHGYRVVYGWRAVGSVPNSDHPKGLALDFMGSDKAKGDALVADVIANGGSYGVTYVIWRGRIWRGGEWDNYSGPSRHYDHVHVSFGSTGIAATPVAGSPLVPDWLEDINDKLTWLTDAKSWARIAMVGGGFLLILIALFSWQSVKDAAIKAGQYARR